MGTTAYQVFTESQMLQIGMNGLCAMLSKKLNYVSTETSWRRQSFSLCTTRNRQCENCTYCHALNLCGVAIRLYLYLIWICENNYGIHLASVFNIFEIITIINSYYSWCLHGYKCNEYLLLYQKSHYKYEVN